MTQFKYDKTYLHNANARITPKKRSMRNAAKLFGIPYSTLQIRFIGVIICSDIMVGKSYCHTRKKRIIYGRAVILDSLENDDINTPENYANSNEDK